MDPFTVLGLMGASLGLLVVHRAELDGDVPGQQQEDGAFYPHIRDTLITTLARGLTAQS